MVKRKVVKIDEEKCTGCEACVPNCFEGALQIIDGKARLISDLFCDGLGACLGHCPEGAISIEEREAEPYDERRVMEENIVPKGENTIKAHLAHLKDHGAMEYLHEAQDYLKEIGIPNPLSLGSEPPKGMIQTCGCPGAKMMDFSADESEKEASGPSRRSQLRQWPVQLHLVPPTAPYFQGKDVLLAADCTAYARGDFHKDHLKGKGLAIACPKLDSGEDVYIDKLVSMIDDAKINSLTVMIMQVPCCRGLLNMAQMAVKKAERKIPIKLVVVGIKGEILSEEWI